MSNKVKIAFYTDFSNESRVALNTLIFNTWGFDFDLDILCLSEKDNMEYSKSEMEGLKKELDFNLENGHQIKSKIFSTEEEKLLLSHLNNEDYFCLMIGVSSSETEWKPGSILYNFYYHIKKDLIIIPLSHQVKIENRGMIALEFENLEKLYALKKSEEFFKFYFAKLKLVIISDDLLSKDDNEMITEFTAKILPGIDIQIVNFEKAVTQELILYSVLESPIDYFIYFNDDYLEDVVHGKLEAAILPGIHKFTLARVWINDELLENLKYGEAATEKLQLKTFEEDYISQ